MPMFKDLLSRARKAARDHLPEEVVAAGKKLRDMMPWISAGKLVDQEKN